MTAVEMQSLRATGARRLLSACFKGSPHDQLVAHREMFTTPSTANRHGDAALIQEILEARLTGRGGAAFPTGKKMQAVLSAKGRAVVVANATEGEPASSKDAALIKRCPYLVIDGALWAARAVGATEVFVCVDQSAGDVVHAVDAAISARQASGIEGEIKLILTPDRFVAGEESALVNWISRSDPRPTKRPPGVYEKGVLGMPTLVDNAETLAHVALIANYGAKWFKSAGTAEEPGTTLLTVSGAVGRRGVFEVPFGTPLLEVLTDADADPDASVILMGGYFGSWVRAPHLRRALVSNESLRTVNASLGCGVVFVLPRHACGVRETARVLTWMADQSAGQCGPCVNGLASIADLTSRVHFGQVPDTAVQWLERWAGQIEGRGACKLPDGAMRFMRSALDVFAADIDAHKKGRPCAGSQGPLVLPLPGKGEFASPTRRTSAS